MSNRRQVWSWALYDWANSAFATTVMAGFFPVFFKSYWNTGVEATVSTARLGWANGLASVAIVLLSPILGAIADQGGTRKKLLFFFATLGLAMTGALYFVEQGEWFAAVAIYVAAQLGFMGGNVFYDSLIIGVASRERIDAVSAFGFAIGYLGGGVLFAVNVWMTLAPETFGLADAAEAVRISFVTVAVWWAVFSVPIFLWVPEPPAASEGQSGLAAVAAGFRQLKHTVQKLKQLRVVGLFLGAYWLYIDGVDTIIRMAVDYGLALGFDQSVLITALLLVQFVGFPAALAFGWMGGRLGAKQSIFVAIIAYLGITLWATQMSELWEFYGMAVAVGLVQGGIQSLSRSLYARIIPQRQAGEFFGLYNMLGKFAAVLGPILMAVVAQATGSSRLSMGSLVILFIAGAALLWRVDVEKGEALAKAYEEG